MRSINRAFEEYGEDIKEFQWLAYKYDVTGETEFPYTPELQPFVSMGWLHKVGDKVNLVKDGEILLDKAYHVPERPKIKPRKQTPRKTDEVKEYLMSILKLPPDFEINAKYQYQLSGLVEKFGAALIISVAEWYDTSRELLPREYQDLRYQQFMSHGMFQALRKWMIDGIEQPKADFRNRVC